MSKTPLTDSADDQTITFSARHQRVREQCEKLERENAELREALRELSTMYAHTWDREDGGLMMMGTSVQRFEAAHTKARAALARSSKGES